MPLFISFEGPDGSGKSTQAKMLAEALRARGLGVVETREPGGTPLGEGIRNLILDPASPEMSPLAMALLMSASRAQLLREIILPALGGGKIVIVDRYADSTLAYQSYGLGLDAEVVRNMTAIATDGVQPDVTVYVDVPVEVGLERVAARGMGNRLDAKTVAFHQRVRSGYLDMVQQDPERWFQINGAAHPDQVHREIMALLERHL